jgi:hypothetical protein
MIAGCNSNLLRMGRQPEAPADRQPGRDRHPDRPRSR